MTASDQPVMTRPLTTVFAVACGVMVANLYYAQALIGEIAPALGMDGATAGLIVTLTQIGYGAGLLLIVSLADLVENRRLILTMMVVAVAGLLGVAMARTPEQFLIFSFLTGFGSVGAQILVPLAAHLAPDRTRGRVIGNIMGGLITGIMLARPLASALAGIGGWRTIFVASVGAMVLLAIVLAKTLPERRPKPGMHYGQILASSVALLVRTPAIRRRTAYQATMFAVFNLFWTAVPLVLGQRFGLGHMGIALFALAGAGGALAAPVAGRMSDRGMIRIGTAIALGSAVAACLVAGWSVWAHTLAMLTIAAIVLDAATQLNQVLGQRVIYSIAPEARGRINAIYMTIVFLGGATGSMLASYSYYHGGWTATALVGAGMSGAALLLFLTEPRA